MTKHEADLLAFRGIVLENSESLAKLAGAGMLEEAFRYQPRIQDNTGEHSPALACLAGGIAAFIAG